MATPTFHAPKVNDTLSSSDINQFLTTHAASLLNQGRTQVSYLVTATGGQNTNTGTVAQWLAQPFVTGSSQTTITRIEINIKNTGGGADTNVELRTDDGSGNPSNTILFTCSLPLDFQPSTTAAWVSIPCNVTGLTASTRYHIVIDGTSVSTTAFCRWSTAATSVNAGLKSASGTGGWSSVAVTFLFNVFAGSQGVVRNVIEDCPVGGPPAKWTGIDYTTSARDGSSVPITIRESVGTLRSIRTLAYSSGQLISVT